MEKIKAKVEQVLHKDKDHTSTTHGTTAGTGTHTGTHTGAHTGAYSDPSGPHNSHMANKADPRVDSDYPGATGNTGGARDTTGLGHSTHGTTGLGSNTHSTGLGSNTTSTHGTTGLGNTTHSTGLGSNTTSTHGTTGLGNTTHSDPSGPHNSKLANKLDPRVDSTQPGALGNSGSAAGHTTTGHHTGAGLSSGTTGAYGSDPSGPHDSRLANSADPRVDHDRDGSRTVGNTGAGYSGTHTGTGLAGAHSTGTYGSDPTGPHDSRLANSADPRVDHDRDGSRTVGNTGAGYSGTTGTGLTGGHSTTGAGTGYSGTGYSGTTTGTHLPGPAGNTAGPHKSDMLNKADPRVDSDLDGSNTMGQNQTYR